MHKIEFTKNEKMDFLSNLSFENESFVSLKEKVDDAIKNPIQTINPVTFSKNIVIEFLIYAGIPFCISSYIIKNVENPNEFKLVLVAIGVYIALISLFIALKFIYFFLRGMQNKVHYQMELNHNENEWWNFIDQCMGEISKNKWNLTDFKNIVNSTVWLNLFENRKSQEFPQLFKIAFQEHYNRIKIKGEILKKLPEYQAIVMQLSDKESENDNIQLDKWFDECKNTIPNMTTESLVHLQTQLDYMIKQKMENPSFPILQNIQKTLNI